MILLKEDRERYGMSYQGSKTHLVEKIARFFPNADHFYDLFGGGFSVSHYMIKHRSKSYKTFHYNELRPGLCELIQDAIEGKYNYDVFKPEWITRERFMAEKESNAYIKIIWSFCNGGNGYIFGRDIESQKRSLHQAIIFDEFDDFIRENFKIGSWPNKLTITGKRLYATRQLACSRINLQQLERLQRLQRLQQPHFTNKSYEQVEIKENSVIYCDIPYRATADYGNKFSHDKFFDWASSQNNPVFISEYNIDDSRFKIIKEFKHRSSFSSTQKNEVKERIYGNALAYEIISEFINKKVSIT